MEGKYVCICMCIYIYIEREREREKEIAVHPISCLHANTHIHTRTHERRGGRHKQSHRIHVHSYFRLFLCLLNTRLSHVAT